MEEITKLYSWDGDSGNFTITFNGVLIASLVGLDISQIKFLCNMLNEAYLKGFRRGGEFATSCIKNHIK